ncbi:MAG: TetR/AcrR family transcriptional regulator [Miltoncostaeaceae bacterium]
MPPGRPRTFDTDAALDAAVDVFWRRGYRRTTTRDLESALGLGQSSISSAFGSKVDLADRVFGRYLERLDAGLIAPLRQAPDGLAAIDRFLAGLGEWHAADGGRGCLVGRFAADGAGAEPRLAARLAQHRTALRRALDAALERAARDGEIDGDDRGTHRDLVVAVVLGLNLALQAGYRPGAHAALVRAGRAQVAAWAATAPGA